MLAPICVTEEETLVLGGYKQDSLSQWLEVDKTCCWLVPIIIFNGAQNDNREKEIQHNIVPSYTAKQGRIEIWVVLYYIILEALFGCKKPAMDFLLRAICPSSFVPAVNT